LSLPALALLVVVPAGLPRLRSAQVDTLPALIASGKFSIKIPVNSNIVTVQVPATPAMPETFCESGVPDFFLFLIKPASCRPLCGEGFKI